MSPHTLCCKHRRTFPYAYPWHAQTLHSHISCKSWRKTVIKPASPHIFNILLNFLMGSELLTSVGRCLQPIRQLADGCKCWFRNDSKRNNFKNCFWFIMNTFFVVNHGSLTAHPCPGIVGRAQYFPNQIPALNPACTRPRWRNDAVFPRQIHFIPSQSSITPADESANYSQVWLLFRGQSIAKPCAEYQGLD